MTYLHRALPALTLNATLMGSAAMADVTSQEVWAYWKSYFSDAGYEVSATETVAGNALELSDLELSQTLPEDAGTVKVSMGGLSLVDNGDGTVNLVCPPSLPVRVETVVPDADPAVISMDISCAQVETVISGTADAFEYAYEGPELSGTLTEVSGLEDEVDLGELKFALNGIKGRDVYKTGAQFDMSQDFAAETFSYTFRATNAGDGSAIAMNAQGDDLKYTGSGTTPKGVSPGDPEALAALDFGGTFSYGAAKSEIALKNPESGTVALSTQAAGSTGSLAMRAGRMEVALESKDVTLAMTEGAPLPLALSIAEAGIDWAFPFVPSDEPQGFALGVRLTDAVMSDMIWALFDPQGKLPRDPVTVELDLDGKARLLADLTDPEVVEKAEAEGTSLGELQEITLNTLTLRAAGAQLSGTGAARFETPQNAAFPVPDGKVELRLTGGNALMDALVAAGLMPPEQAMGARMMLGLFATPVPGEDALISVIEFRPDGQVLANGQRIK